MMNVMPNVLKPIKLEKTKQILFEIFMSDDAIVNTQESIEIFGRKYSNSKPNEG